MYNSIFAQLLDDTNLPEYFNKDPLAAQGFTLLYSGTTGIATIEAGVLSTRISGGSGSNLTYNLNQYTLGSLVTAINTKTGYTATLLGSSTTSALALMEVQSMDIVTTAYQLNVFTSLLWQLLTVMAVALNTYGYKQIVNGINEEFLPHADSNWLDYWGVLYGNITRQPGELDTTYSAKIIAEITRNRLSARDISIAILQELAIQATVFDHQHAVVKIVGESYVGDQIIVDRAHSLNQMYIFGLSQNIVNDANTHNVVNENRAAGINPQYTYNTPNLNASLATPFMIIPMPISPVVS